MSALDIAKTLRFARWPSLVIVVAGGASVLLGLMVLVGWHTQIAALVQVRPAFVPMQYNTALGFLLCGAGLLFATFARPRLAAACGATTGVIGVLTLFEYLFGVGFGIDRLFMEPFITVKTAHPGRMALTTAFAFVLSGAGLLCLVWPLRFRHGAVIVGVLGTAVAALGAATFLSYLAGEDAPYGWVHPTYMAVHTAAGFAVLGTGIFLSAWRKAVVEEGGTPHWLAFPVGIGVATLTVVLWQMLVAQEHTNIARMVGRQADNLKTEIKERIEPRIQALVRLAGRWEYKGGTARDEWIADAARYVADFSGYQAIEWVDASYHVRWIAPLQGNEPARDLDLTFEGSRRAALLAAREAHAVTVTHPIELVQGGKGFLVYVPLFPDDKFGGFIVGVFGVRKILDPILEKVIALGYSVSIRDNDKEIYGYDHPDRQYDEAFGHETQLKLRDVGWRIRVLPSPELFAESRSLLPATALAAGLSLALLMGFTVYLAQKSRRQIAEVARTNRDLSREITERKRMEGALEESELWLRGIFNSLEEGVLVATPDRLMADINPAAQTMLGYSQQDIVDQPTEMVHVDRGHYVEFGNRIKAAFDKGEAARFEFELKRKNGEVFPSEHTVSLLKNEQGEAVGIVSTIQDITVRKQAEEELRRYRDHLEELVVGRAKELVTVNEQLRQEIDEHRQAEEELRAQTRRNELILNTAQDGFWIVDLDGKVRDVNDAYCKMVGYSREQLLAMTVADVEACESPEEIQDHIQKVIKRGYDRFETRQRRRDGTVIDLDVSVSLADFSGERFFFTFFRDISERKQTEEDLKASLEYLERLAVHLQSVKEEERARIAREIHDELGQALTALNMDIHWLLQRFPEHRQVLVEKARSMIKLVESTIKVVQRISAELRPAVLDDLGLEPAVTWYAEQYQGRTGIPCKTSVALDGTRLHIDRSTEVFRILQEALTNISRHADASTVTIDLASKGGQLVMDISDDGRGITADEMNSNTAFGIMSIRERALALGGKVTIEGHTGIGTKISLRVPLVENRGT